jgi:hypothetical protein
MTTVNAGMIMLVALLAWVIMLAGYAASTEGMLELRALKSRQNWKQQMLMTRHALQLVAGTGKPWH